MSPVFLRQENDNVVCLIIKPAVANFISLGILTAFKVEMHAYTFIYPKQYQVSSSVLVVFASSWNVRKGCSTRTEQYNLHSECIDVEQAPH